MAQRSSQLDALLLDSELCSMLFDQLSAVFAQLPAGRVALERYAPEARLALGVAIWAATVGRGGQTPGYALMNLRRVAGARRGADAVGGGAVRRAARTGTEGAPLGAARRYAWLLSAVVAPWAFARARDAMAARRWGSQPPGSARRRLWDAHGYAERFASVASLGNWVLFLMWGGYPTVSERVAGARAVPARADVGRAPDFEELSRQLVWRELSETMLYILPVLSAQGARVRAMMRGVTSAGGGKGTTLDADTRSHASGCPVCGSARCVAPYAAEPCGHVYCYYCLRALAADAERRGAGAPRCARCFEPIEAMRRKLPPRVDAEDGEAEDDTQAVADGVNATLDAAQAAADVDAQALALAEAAAEAQGAAAVAGGEGGACDA